MVLLKSNVGHQYEDPSVAAQESTGRSCDKLRMELKRCIKESICVQVDGRKAQDCLNSKENVPDRCYILLSNFTDCKKSLVDMRARFRGRKGDM
uniref:Cytochrome c oxidase assembly factor 5 n=1 Tax=Rhabditophanes sp. KR3021 TaxID=114890 RepID=A0AC35U8L8_9BILA